MPENASQAYYSLFKAKDSRHDGQFYVGVSSTGVYCRPVCRAKMPKPENCRFYASAAAAEQAGYRPCLLCRPELAPGAAPLDATLTLAQKAARLLEENCGNGVPLEEISGRLGYTPRHLRRAFVAEYHVSPIQYLQTCRLLLAKQLLTDTDLSVIAVAMAAGFGSLRRFNDLFQKRYRLSPRALRRQAPGELRGKVGITLALGYRPPYLWERMLDFLALRAIPGVEAVRDGEYLRTVRYQDQAGKTYAGWIRVGHRERDQVLTVSVAAELLPVLPQTLARIKHLFDLSCNPQAVAESLAGMDRVRPGLPLHGLRVPGCVEPFEMAVRAVLGQQITVVGARTLAARLVGKFGVPLPTGLPDLTHTFPTAREIAALPGRIGDHLGPLGITGIRAEAIRELAEKMLAGEIAFHPGADPEEEIAKLMTIRGIGEWTARYIAMRALSGTDAFLPSDYGVKKALAPRSEKEIAALAEAWRPWRSYATVNLWNSL